jgi:hypothetical protein
MRSKSLSYLANIHGHAVLSLVTESSLLQWDTRRIIGSLVNASAFICWFHLLSTIGSVYGLAPWLYQPAPTNKKACRGNWRISCLEWSNPPLPSILIISLVELLVAKTVVDRPPAKSRFKMAVACLATLAKYIRSASATTRSCFPQRKLEKTQ